MEAADNVLAALNRIRSGTKVGGKNIERKKRAREETLALFKGRGQKRQKSEKAWRHRFVCLGYRDQDRIPTTDYEKDLLYQDGLGEKEVAFPSLEMDSASFKELILTTFPKLSDGGGFLFLKCLPNSRKLEILSTTVYTTPSILKQRVGNSRTYIRPIQKDLDLSPVEDAVTSEFRTIPPL